MIEHHYILPADESEGTKKNRFPIVIQLGVLGIILGGLFGSILFNQAPSKQISATPITPQKNTIAQTTAVQSIEEIEIVGKAAYVWDIQGQRALYTKNADTPLPLASITKLMTSLLAHELITANEKTAVSINAIRQEGSSGLMAGERFTIGDLQQLALISSSNDAAYELSASVGNLLGEKDPTNQFITGMNIRAEELGLTTLEFSNTTGLDLSSTKPGAVGSARDVSFLLEHILIEYPDLLLPTTGNAARVYNEAGAYHDIENTNPVVNEIPNLLGSKTGYTDLAGGNLTVVFDVGLNRPIVVTVLGSTHQDRFSDVLALVNATRDSFANIQ